MAYSNQWSCTSASQTCQQPFKLWWTTSTAILKHELRGTTIHMYMDDIGIVTQTNINDHIAAVCDILQVAQIHDLYFKPEKCLFHVPSMDYLGVILEKGVTHMDPVKIAGINTWLTPKTVTEVRWVVGFFNFYCPFIKGFAHIACPLHQLTHKNQEWWWGKDKQQAFNKLKALVTADPVLAHANLKDQFKLEVDASGYMVGAVLLQCKEDGKKHPIHCMQSRVFSQIKPIENSVRC